MVLKYSFEIFFLKCIFEFMKNTAPYKGSNSVNGGERYFNIINFNKQLAQWLHCGVVRGCNFFRWEVLSGYFRFFFLSSFFYHLAFCYLFSLLILLASRDFCENIFLVEVEPLGLFYTRKKKARPAYVRRVLIVLNKTRTSRYKRHITSKIRHDYQRTGVKGYP